jgi:ATP-binding cassette subfamily C protein CydCD
MNLDRHLLRLASRQKFALMLAIGLGAAGGIFTVLQAGLLSRTISLVFLGESSGKTSLEQVPTLMALLAGAILIRYAFVWGSELSAGSIALHIKQELRESLYKHIETLGPSFTSEQQTGELTGTAMEGIEALDAYFSQYLPQLALAAIVPVIILVFVFPLDWLSGLVLLLTAPLIPIFMILIGSVAQTLTGRQWQTLSRMSAYFLDLIQGLTALKILGRSRAQIQVLEQVNDSFRQTTMSVLRVTFLSALVLELVSTLSTAVVAVEVGLRLLYGQLAFEQALFVLILAPEFYLPLRMLGARFHAGMAGNAAAKRIFEVLGRTTDDRRPQTDDGRPQTDDRRPTTADREATAVSPSSVFRPPSTNGRSPSADRRPSVIDFRSVTYSYPGERHALHEVTFQITAGQKIALIGPSGGGKSTIANLLMGFLQPQQGRIDVDGRPLEDIPTAEWRSRVAWVPQAPHLFQGPLADNLRLAKPEATQHELEQAARLANLHDFIQGLPAGYDTALGEGGIGLSGGQAQRLALARAFLKDAPFLILDEATANLDPEQEALIQESLQRLLAGRTALVIAHRLHTIRQANQILVLDQGRVVESGTHEALLKRDGLYRKLVDTYRRGPIEETQPPQIPPAPLRISEASSSDITDSRRESPDIDPSSREWTSASLAAAMPGSEREATRTTPIDQLPASGSRSAWKNFSRLLSLAAPYTGWAALSVLTGSSAIACGIGLMATSAYILSAAALQPSIAELQVAIVGVRFFGIGRGLFRYLERNLSHEVTFRLLGNLRLSFYRALEPLAPARLQQLHSGDLLARIHGDIATLENFYVRVLAPPLVAIMITLGVTLWLGSFDLRIALALAGAWLLAGIGLPLLIHSLGTKPSREHGIARVQLNIALVDGIQGLADLAIFDLAGQFAKRFQATNRRLVAAQWRLVRLGAAQTALAGAMAHLGMWTVLLLAIPLVRSGQVEGVYLASLALAALASFEAINPLPVAAQHLENSLQAVQRLFEIVDAEPAVREPLRPQPVPEQLEMEMNDVGFAYPPRPAARVISGISQTLTSQPALEGVSFQLIPGRCVAIVGPSGAGKSTLAGLLLRFWVPQSGEILLRPAGNPAAWWHASAFNSYELRSRIGVLSQHTYLFAASLRDNLRLARPKASQDEIEAAARQAHLHAWIESLPEGYATWIGEQGLRLSAGQRQRVAIARLLLQNAPVMILDEPTANLDAITESAIMQELLATNPNRSTLLITHRLAGLESFEEILVLHQGQIVERGSFPSLMEQRGYFRKMWELQAGYVPDS